MRVWLTALLAAAVTLAAAGPASAAAGSLTDVSDAGSFPHRTWVLSLPGGQDPSPKRVRVLENGAPVSDLVVSRSGTADAAGRPSASVLVIDASKSMRGRPIREAMAAARAFADRRRENQALGVVVFNRSARVLLAPTTDPDAIAAALRRPPRLGPHTSIGAGIDVALASLAESGVGLGSMIVLSDGDDTGAPGTLTRARRRAEVDNVRIFTVALRSKGSVPTSLEGLAAATGGAAAVAESPRDVRRVFAALGERLRSEYQVSYRSTASPDARVRVEANGGGGAPEAVAAYRAPTAAAAIAPGTYSTGSFWASSTAVVAVTLACMLLIGIASALALHRPARAPLPDRIAAYAESAGGVGAVQERRVAGMAKIVERGLGATGGRWERFVEDVDVARVRRSAAELALAAGAGLALLVVLGALTGLVVFSLVGLAIPVAMVGVIRLKGTRERARFNDQLAENMQVFASALRAGHSFTGALGTVARDAAEPTHREFTRALADERVGLPIDEALARVGHRMRSTEMTQVAMIGALQQETGGNTAEVLDRVVDNIRERQDVRRLVSTLTAQGRMSQLVVTALPFAMALLITVMNPGYLTPLFESAVGIAMVLVALVMVALGSISLRKIVNVRI